MIVRTPTLPDRPVDRLVDRIGGWSTVGWLQTPGWRTAARKTAFRHERW